MRSVCFLTREAAVWQGGCSLGERLPSAAASHCESGWVRQCTDLTRRLLLPETRKAAEQPRGAQTASASCFPWRWVLFVGAAQQISSLHQPRVHHPHLTLYTSAEYMSRGVGTLSIRTSAFPFLDVVSFLVLSLCFCSLFAFLLLWPPESRTIFRNSKDTSAHLAQYFFLLVW